MNHGSTAKPTQRRTDRLQREHLVAEIATLAATAKPPLVLGVHGDWGSGKTSFMKQVRNKLQEDPRQDRVVTVEFEAWRYQNEPVPIVALLHAMRRQFSLLKKTWGKTEKIAHVTFRSLLASMDQIAKLIGLEALPFSPDKIQSIGEAREKQQLETALVTDEIHEFLEHAIDGLLPLVLAKKEEPRVVIFIDDLDRCNPDMAYKLLEGLKIYLNLKNCVFVLAMNQQIVIKAIASAMKKDDDDARVRLEAEAYLEKLCANIWRLPPLDPVIFLSELLHEPIPKLAIADASRMEYGFLPPNPRRLKALANLYNRLWQRVAATANDAPDKYLIALRVLVVAYVYQFHSELFQRWRHEPRFFLRLKDWLSGRLTTDTKNADNACFWGLILPTEVRIDPNEATAQTIVSSYPDPTAPGIFWIAPLLQSGGLLAADGPQDYPKLLGLENLENAP